MGRTATNVIGNSLATAAIAKWEGKLGPTVADTDEDETETLAPEAGAVVPLPVAQGMRA
jgi:Na+/H+-dicarboxylate symporter